MKSWTPFSGRWANHPESARRTLSAQNPIMTSTSSYPALLDALRDISSTEQTARTHDRERRNGLFQ
jgi:hypothetical protein